MKHPSAPTLKTQAATLHELMIIGEAVKGLSAEFRVRHTEVPWRDMSRMRDILIHRYHNVDLPTVWLTVLEDIPALIALLEPLSAPSSGDESINDA